MDKGRCETRVTEHGGFSYWKHSARGKETRGLEQGTRGDLSVKDTIILTVISWQQPWQVQDFKLEGWGRSLPVLPTPCQEGPGRSPQVRSALPPLRQQSSAEKMETANSVTQSSLKNQARTSTINQAESEFPSMPDRL